MDLEKRELLRGLREDIGLTQEDVAREIGIDRSTYTKTELGYPIRVNTAKKIAGFYNIDWSMLFDDQKVL